MSLQDFPDVNQYYVQNPFGTQAFKPYFCTPKTSPLDRLEKGGY
jgi:hypothetical protein